MATLTRSAPSYAREVNTAVGTATAITLTLFDPPAGQIVVVDSITYAYTGSTQTSNAINLQTTGGGTTYWLTWAVGPSAGLCSQQWTFPGGLRCATDGESIDFTAASMANCSQRVCVSFHIEATG
jgi:hypothetical protein